MDPEDGSDWREKAYPCHDCKIGFESKKHYSAHKMNYCINRSGPDSPGSNSPRSASPNNLQNNHLLQAVMMLRYALAHYCSSTNGVFSQLHQPAASLLNLNVNWATTIAESMKNQNQLNQTLEVFSKIQKLKNFKNFENSPLDLSKDASVSGSVRLDVDLDPDAVAKVEEIESDCERESRDTRVSV